MKFGYADEAKDLNGKAIAALIERMEKERRKGYEFGRGLQVMLGENGATSDSQGKRSKKRTAPPSQTYGGKWRGPTGKTPDPAEVTSKKNWPDGGISYICRGGKVVYVP